MVHSHGLASCCWLPAGVGLLLLAGASVPLHIGISGGLLVLFHKVMVPRVFEETCAEATSVIFTDQESH